jgi:23S rRNA (cytidine2498-2'-O)-methyltransferase
VKRAHRGGRAAQPAGKPAHGRRDRPKPHDPRDPRAAKDRKRDPRDPRGGKDRKRGHHPGGPRPEHKTQRGPHASSSRPEHKTQHAPSPAPARVDPEKLAQALSKSQAPLREGEWLWTTREGAERDLIEELLWSGDNAIRPRLLGPALVASAKAPQLRDGRLDLTFARQGFQVSSLVRVDSSIADAPRALAEELLPSLKRGIEGAEQHALHVFVPDSTGGNTLSARAQAIRDMLEAQCPHTLDEAQLRRQSGLLAQICVVDAQTAALGCMPSDRAQSPWPGGRARMRLGGSFPSRAARKLAEAFAWLGLAPGSGELCVDLGAAPGGWSWLLLEKRARVIAVDPARMDAELMRNPRLRHVQGNAFEYEPEEPVDWLFCDMAYRPLEVAQMLGRWARRRHTRLLVSNFKLPMKRKVEMVERIRGLLADSGFTGLRTRQLYHDREEITLTAHVR